ncbi:MAG TPA: transcriptional repressor [Frankiaceae bacterium]|nr:transcriptional repressor [Frankiaceae bacterium]
MSGTAWQAQLREKGYRLTPQRQLVLEAVQRLGHATPDEIAAEVRRTAASVNISTVYRTLELLERLELLTHVHLGHGAPTYHPTGTERHLHLVCSHCERIDEVPPEVVAGVVDALARERGFVVRVDHVTLSGLCADCAAFSPA